MKKYRTIKIDEQTYAALKMDSENRQLPISEIIWRGMGYPGRECSVWHGFVPKYPYATLEVGDSYFWDFSTETPADSSSHIDSMRKFERRKGIKFQVENTTGSGAQLHGGKYGLIVTRIK